MQLSVPLKGGIFGLFLRLLAPPYSDEQNSCGYCCPALRLYVLLRQSYDLSLDCTGNVRLNYVLSNDTNHFNTQTAYAASATGKRENAQCRVFGVVAKQTVSHATKCRHTP